MATQAVAVSAVSSPDGWSLGAGASKLAAVAADDADTSYIASGTTTNTQEQFAITNWPNNAADVITSVAVRATCKRGGSQSCTYQVTLVLGASTSAGASQT